VTPTGAQTPRIYSVPDYASTTGREAIELAAMAGLILDPWQEFVLVNALGEKADGRWAAFEVGVDVARQNGKGGILEARELTGAYLLSEMLMIHSAHQFDTSIEAFLRMDNLLEGCADLSRRVLRVSRSHGSEGFTFKGGQRLRYRTRTKGGGRGFTGDLLILDEAMILPESFHGALLPTLSAKSMAGSPQVWYTGSAVDQMIHEDGLVFSRLRERGRKGDPGLAWFEWSADVDTPDRVTDEIAADHEMWAQANPGLGIRISVEHIEKERASLSARAFAVERLGVGDWPNPDGEQAIIDPAGWLALADAASTVDDPVCFAFDVTPDRSSASIGVAGARPDGLPHVEVVESRRGTGWVAARIVELLATHKALGVVCDGASPAASLVPALEALKVEVTLATAKEHGQGCGMIYDAVDQAALRHLGTTELTAAIRGATRRPLGDAWAWSRKSVNTDISPLVAVTLALWGFQTIERPKGAPRVIDLSAA
jgi:hypothetical protein